MKKRRAWSLTAVWGLAALLLMVGLVHIEETRAETSEETQADPQQTETAEDGTIYSGIYLGQVDVSGMTQEEAAQAYEAWLEELRAVTVEFCLAEESCTVEMAELNPTAPTEEAIQQAYAYGRYGNLLKRYKEITDVSESEAVIPVELSVDDDYLIQLLEEQLSDYIIPATDASIEYTDGELVITDGESGKELNAEATVNELLTAIGEWSGGDLLTVQVATNEMEPTHTAEELEAVQDVLGSFETYYSSGDSSRNNNLRNAAEKINGSVVYPGEEFDTMAHLTPFTTDNGWSYAGAYLNGEVISDIGGGICQVSTTLYNAVLAAELEVTERYPHSMAVGYVQLSADAALNEGTKNLRFVNNTDDPIFIYAYASGGTLHVSIYGKEYRSEGRTVEYKNEILEVIPAGDPIETIDESQPSDYREVTQSAHTGYRAKLWKYVYEDGELVDTVLVNTSSYSASAERVTIGKPADEGDTSTEASTEAAATEAPTTEAPTTETSTTAEDTTAAQPAGDAVSQ